MQLTLIYNLNAGEGIEDPEELHRRLKRLGYRVRSQSRSSDDFPSALAEPTDLVIAAGGDGTVAKVARKLPDRRVPVTIFPSGVANNIARSFGIAGSIEELAEGWRAGKEQKLDLFEAGGIWGRKSFVEGMGLGALTKGMIRSRGVEGTREEQLATARTRIIKTLERAKPKPFHMKLDGKAVNGDFLFVDILSITHMGPGIPLSTGGDPGDGMLDVMSLGERGRDGLVDWLRRNDGSPSPLTPRKAGAVEVAWHHTPLRADDDFFESQRRPTRVLAEYSGQSVRILVPAGAAAATGKKR